jgi:threonine dehydratase
VFAAECEAGAPLAAALAAGAPRTVDYRPSFVDGIGSRSVFPAMFERAQAILDGSIVCTLADIGAALRLLAERARVIAEGAGACSVAAALSGRAGSGKVACIVSGGNIDSDALASLLTGRLPAPPGPLR